jgi:GAF domain-containing protein/Sel1 repeat-containing protein
MPESNELRYDSEEPIPPVSVDLRSLPQADLKALASQLLSRLGADGVAIAAAIPANATYMICTVSCGNIAPPVGALLDVNSGISGQCVRERQALHTGDTSTDSRVDKEACNRLGIRSVVVSPILRDSNCIGILEVFSSQADAFDDAALISIEEEAARAACLIKVEEPVADLQVPATRDGAERFGLFLVDKHGRLSESEPVAEDDIEENAVVGEDSDALPKFLSTSPVLAQPRRWIAFAVAIVATSILGFVLIRYMSVSGSVVPKGPSAASAPNDRPAAEYLPTMSSLVSDAAPEVRVLMAKAIAGNSAAQTSLAEHYAAGNGVTRDRVKAAVWYVMAGARGDTQASRSAVRLMQNLQPFEMNQTHFNLGTMFRDGIGTSRNLIVAYSWFSLAQTGGDVRATAALLNLEQVMKPTEVAEGRRRAAIWLDSHRAAVSPQSP